MYNVDIGVPGKLYRVTATQAATGTSAAAVSGTYAAVANRKLAVTHFSGSSDVAGIATIESPAGTVLWNQQFAGTNWALSENFEPPLVIQTVNQGVVFKVGSMVAINKSTVNALGFEIYSG